MENNTNKVSSGTALNNRHSHFRISAKKNNEGDFESIDMECRINAEEKESCNNSVPPEDGSFRNSKMSSFNISAKKDAAGELRSVEMDCCISPDNVDIKENSSLQVSPKTKCWVRVLCDIITEAWRQRCDQISNLVVPVLVTAVIWRLQYFDVVSVSFSELSSNVFTICTSIAGLTFAALTLILPLAKYLRSDKVDYHKSLASVFSYTILVNLFTVLCALVMSWVSIRCSCACMVLDYLLMFLLIYSIVLACSATLHCFCVHTFIDPKK